MLSMPPSHHQGLSRAELPATDLSRPQELAAVLAAALRQSSVVRMQGPRFAPATRKKWDKVVRALGQPCFEGEDSATGSKDSSMWMDVSYHPDRQNTFRHSCTAQPLHTDGAYNNAPPEIVIFVCQETASSGGATIFVSAETVARQAKEKDGRLYDNLFALPVPYGKAGVRGRSIPVLTQTPDGLRINWNYYRVLRDESKEVHDFAEGFHRFLQEQIVAQDLVVPLTLLPGETLIFKDQCVLHGRTAFAPGPRCLWKCGVMRRTN